MPSSSTRHKNLKICCGVTTIFLVTVVIILTTLAFTVFKPKHPEITAHPVGLENIVFSGFSNVTLGMVITIDNRNYGSFKFKNTTTYINYHGVVITEAPIPEQFVPARREINITTSGDLMVDKLISNPYFWGDVGAGSLNMTSTATMHAKISMLNILKLHANAIVTCDISVFISSKDVESKCKSKIKF